MNVQFQHLYQCAQGLFGMTVNGEVYRYDETAKSWVNVPVAVSNAG